MKKWKLNLNISKWFGDIRYTYIGHVRYPKKFNNDAKIPQYITCIFDLYKFNELTIIIIIIIIIIRWWRKNKTN